MIKQINLTNWKSYEKSSLYIDPLTILIGTNASGKSNVLDALVFLQRATSGLSLHQSIFGDMNISPLRGGAEWICRRGTEEFSIEVIFGSENQFIDYKYSLTVRVHETVRAEVSQEELLIQRYGPRSTTAKEKRLFYTQQQDVAGTPSIPAYFASGTNGPGKRLDLNRSFTIINQAESLLIRKEIQDAVRLVINQLQKIFVFDPIPSHMRGYTPFSDKLQSDGSNIAGVLAALEIDEKQLVEQILTDYLRKLPERDIAKVWAESVGRFKTDAMIYCSETWHDGNEETVDARGMSDGTLRYLAIVTAMLTRAEGSLLVIEEIDNGLHPSRAKILINMLRDLGRDRGIDVIVTTHNPALLDAAGNKMVPFITVAHRDLETGFSVLTPLEDIEKLDYLMARGSLGRLSTEGAIEKALMSGDSL
ncbi:AAA family ATPase [Aeromonas veronii]